MSRASEPTRASRSKPLRVAGAVFGLGMWLAGSGCSLTRPDTAECNDNQSCQASFGLGFVCGAEGLCEKVAPSPRCTESFPDDLLTRPEQYAGYLVYGMLADRSLATHSARENAVRLVAERIDELGGIDGKKFGVVFCTVEQNSQFDSLARTDAAIASANYLAHGLGVPAIIGPMASPDARAVYDALKGSGTLIMSPSATSAALIGIDTASPTDEKPGLLWRTAPSDSIQGAAIASYLLSQSPVPSVAVIAEEGEYGEGLSSEFLPRFTTGGGTAEVFNFDSAGARDSAIFDAGSRSVDFVLFFSSQTTDAVAFLDAVSTLSEYDTKQLFLTDSGANQDLLSMAPASVFPRVRGSRPQVPSGTIYDQFIASYKSAYGTDPTSFTFVAHAYDAAWMVFLGAAWATFNDSTPVRGIGVARGLRWVSSGDSIPFVPSNWPRAVEQFRAGKGIDALGASGQLNYDLSSEETYASIDIWRISGGSVVVETTISPM